MVKQRSSSISDGLARLAWHTGRWGEEKSWSGGGRKKRRQRCEGWKDEESESRRSHHNTWQHWQRWRTDVVPSLQWLWEAWVSTPNIEKWTQLRATLVCTHVCVYVCVFTLTVHWTDGFLKKKKGLKEWKVFDWVLIFNCWFAPTYTHLSAH